MELFLLRVYRYFERHPWLCRICLSAVCLLFCACLLRLHFVEDVGSFFPNTRENRRMNEAYQHIGAANKIMISVQPTDTSDADAARELVMEVCDVLAEKLEANDSDDLMESVFYMVDQTRILGMTRFLVENMPYYLDSADYAMIARRMSADSIRSALESDKKWLLSPMGSWMKNVIAMDPLHFSSGVLSSLADIRQSDAFQTIDGYVFDKEGKEAILAVSSRFPVSETFRNKQLIRNIDASVKDVQEQYGKDVEIKSIGAAVISVGNAERIKKDTLISVLVALLLILALLSWFFKDVRALFIILFSIAFGLLFGLAFLAIFKQSVSLIAIGVGSIIIGIAVNYPLHFLAHYQQGYSKEQTIKDIISPLVTGNITTVGAFLSLIFISSDAMKDLGLFASMLLVGSILFVLFFLPHLFPHSLFRKQQRLPEFRFGKVAEFRLEKYPFIVLLVLLLTVPLFFFSREVRFDSDMNHINYMTPEHKMQMEKLIRLTESGNPQMYCVSEGASMEEALQHYESVRPLLDSLQKEGAILKINGISSFIPSKELQSEKIEEWENFWKDKREPFLNAFRKATESAGFQPGAFQAFENMLQCRYTPHAIDYFEPLTASFADNYLSEDEGMGRVYTLLETDGKFKDSVDFALNHRESSVFAFDNRSLMSKMVDALSGDFNYVLYVCGLIVFVFLLVSFGRIELSLLAFAPLTVAWVWILGLMYLFDIRFNIVNIILATFIFGMGDDYTIFVTEGMMYEYTYRKKMLASYKNSVLLSASIMFIGIGALILARHPAMHSLAEVTIVGMFSVVLMAYFFPPLIYTWLTKKKGKDRRMPVTLLNLGKTAISFVGFLSGTLYMTLLGFFLLTVGGRTKKHEQCYHKALCGLFRLLVRLLPGVKSRYENVSGETFDKPSVIICNHQSHLDLLYLLAMHPRIVCLTNRWVWNCPFYGQIVRYARCLPVTDRLEEQEEAIGQLLSEGYSVLVFPEGTRSPEGKILRFHQGAFHIARKFGVDVLPIVIHGMGDILPKTEFMLRKGRADIRILNRISMDDSCCKDLTLREFTHRMKSFYEEEYARLSTSVETAEYYEDLVLHNYIYKGASVERRVRREMKKNRGYADAVAALPEEGTYCIRNCGLGEFALLAALVKKRLHIIATDPDSDNLEIARNCISVPKNLKYVDEL